MKPINYIKKLISFVVKTKYVFIVGHKNMDLDAVGSAIAINYLAKRAKRKCYLIVDDERHEPGVEKLLEEFKNEIVLITSKEIESYKSLKPKQNSLIIVDCNKEELLQGDNILKHFKRIVVIDHHIEEEENTISTKYKMIDNEASSTAEMIGLAIDHYELNIDPMIATGLLAGMMVDTNGFSLKVRSKTYYVADALTRLGADSKKVQSLLKQNLIDYRERQKIISNVDMIGNIAISCGPTNTYFEREELAKMADTLMLFNDVDASFIICKIDSETLGISARSHVDDINVGEIMKKFKGGGSSTRAATQIKKATIKATCSKLRKLLEGE